LLVVFLSVFATSMCFAQVREPVKVPKIAMLWTFAENERGTSEAGIRTANDLLRRLFEEKAGFEVVSDAVSRAAWSKLAYNPRPSTVEDPGQVPVLPEPKQILEFGQAAGADFVCIGTLTWRVRSVWVGLGPKTKADATVSVIIVNVNKREIVHEAKEVNSNSTKAEKWYESAGALLLTWGITIFSGGPKTPHIQKSAVMGIGAATDGFFSSLNRKIG